MESFAIEMPPTENVNYICMKYFFNFIAELNFPCYDLRSISFFTLWIYFLLCGFIMVTFIFRSKAYTWVNIKGLLNNRWSLGEVRVCGCLGMHGQL